MTTETLRDAHYRILGYIETRPDGKQVAKDSHYRILGYYDPRRNDTQDAHYRVIARGNILASLVACAC